MFANSRLSPANEPQQPVEDQANKTSRFARRIKRRQQERIEKGKKNMLPTFEEMSVIKCNPRRVDVIERRRKEQSEIQMREKTEKMMFLDQGLKVTTFVTDKDLKKYQLSYRDISPTCVMAQKV
jgi:hypothetical protein